MSWTYVLSKLSQKVDVFIQGRCSCIWSTSLELSTLQGQP